VCGPYGGTQTGSSASAAKRASQTRQLSGRGGGLAVATYRTRSWGVRGN